MGVHTTRRQHHLAPATNRISAYQSIIPVNGPVGHPSGGDKSQNVLWRLDHGGVAGLEPPLVVVLIGNNNMFFTPDNIHLSQDGGYGLYAEKLKSLVEKLLGSQ